MIFISEISNGLGELLTSKIVNKLIEFIDYGYCNNKEISEDIMKQYNEQIKKTKAIIYNLKNIMKD
jgi:hypothetical protein